MGENGCAYKTANINEAYIKLRELPGIYEVREIEEDESN